MLIVFCFFAFLSLELSVCTSSQRAGMVDLVVFIYS